MSKCSLGRDEPSPPPYLNMMRIVMMTLMVIYRKSFGTDIWQASDPYPMTPNWIAKSWKSYSNSFYLIACLFRNHKGDWWCTKLPLESLQWLLAGEPWLYRWWWWLLWSWWCLVSNEDNGYDDKWWCLFQVTTKCWEFEGEVQGLVMHSSSAQAGLNSSPSSSSMSSSFSMSSSSLAWFT